jgi:hypothetical protein
MAADIGIYIIRARTNWDCSTFELPIPGTPSSPHPGLDPADLVFSPFIITLDNDDYKATEYRLTEVENGVQLLSFIVQFEGKSVTVSEYIQPPEFTEIPEFRQRFLDNTIKQYATIQTSNGTIFLGKQVKQNDRQLGIMLERGLIVMFNPEQELTQAEWRRLGEQFDIQKISN